MRWYIEVMGSIWSLSTSDAARYVREAQRIDAAPDPAEFGGRALKQEWYSTERNCGVAPKRFGDRFIRAVDQPRAYWSDVLAAIAEEA